MAVLSNKQCAKQYLAYFRRVMSYQIYLGIQTPFWKSCLSYWSTECKFPNNLFQKGKRNEKLELLPSFSVFVWQINI